MVAFGSNALSVSSIAFPTLRLLWGIERGDERPYPGSLIVSWKLQKGVETYIWDEKRNILWKK